jgi:hypothetical protein
VLAQLDEQAVHPRFERSSSACRRLGECQEAGWLWRSDEQK